MLFAIVRRVMREFLFAFLIGMVLWMLLFAHYAKAETHDEVLHALTHIESGFIVALVSDQVCNKYIGLSAEHSLLLGIGTALTAGMLYKLAETGKVSHMADGIVPNAVGSIASIGAIITFNLNVD